MSARMLVAGIGNVFLGDDAFGVEVVQRLARRPLPDDVEVADIGIRGVHLAYQLMDGYELLVLVDAVSRREPPGTVTVLEPSPPDAASEPLDPHRLEPGPLLASAARLGALPPRVVLVGCEPADVDEGMGFSPEVEAAVDPAVDAVCQLIEAFVEEKGSDDHAEEDLRAHRAGADRLRAVPPAARHPALPAHPADVTTPTVATGRER